MPQICHVLYVERGRCRGLGAGGLGDSRVNLWNAEGGRLAALPANDFAF